jgi:hypothetical protein
MTQSLKNVLAFALLGGIALLGYVMFIQQDSQSLLIAEDGVVSDQLLIQAYSFIEKRSTIDALVIDTSLLLESRYNTLVSYTATVPDQPVGKSSLFEPARPITR